MQLKCAQFPLCDYCDNARDEEKAPKLNEKSEELKLSGTQNGQRVNHRIVNFKEG